MIRIIFFRSFPPYLVTFNCLINFKKTSQKNFNNINEIHTENHLKMITESMGQIIRNWSESAQHWFYFWWVFVFMPDNRGVEGHNLGSWGWAVAVIYVESLNFYLVSIILVRSVILDKISDWQKLSFQILLWLLSFFHFGILLLHTTLLVFRTCFSWLIIFAVIHVFSFRAAFVYWYYFPIISSFLYVLKSCCLSCRPMWKNSQIRDCLLISQIRSNSRFSFLTVGFKARQFVRPAANCLFYFIHPFRYSNHPRPSYWKETGDFETDGQMYWWAKSESAT